MKKSFQQATLELKPFWENLITKHFPRRSFRSKSIWWHRFESGGTPIEAVKLYPSELDDANGILLELVDSNKERLYPEHRVLYKLDYDPNWRKKTEIYAPDGYAKPGGEFQEVFAIRTTDLDQVNKTHVSHAVPVYNPEDMENDVPTMTAAASGTMAHTASGRPVSARTGLFDNPQNEASFPPAGAPRNEPVAKAADPESYFEKDDTHYSAMTIRDMYCMIQNVPMSNKTWLNELIKQGQTYKNQ